MLLHSWGQGLAIWEHICDRAVRLKDLTALTGTTEFSFSSTHEQLLLTSICWGVVHVPAVSRLRPAHRDWSNVARQRSCIGRQEAGQIIIIIPLCLRKGMVTLALAVKPCPRSGQKGNTLQWRFLKQSGLIFLGNYIGLFGFVFFF